MTRNRRAGVEDRWTTAAGEPSANHGKGKRWRARYVDERGREHAKGFARKVDATALARRPDRGDHVGHPRGTAGRAADRGAVV